MEWQEFINSHEAWLNQRARMVEAAKEIRDRYCGYMSQYAQHFCYADHLMQDNAERYKFIPEKSSASKGYLFAVGSKSFRIPAEYLANPEAWEAEMFGKIEDRYALIRNSASPEFINALGDLDTAEATDAGIEYLQFNSKGYRTTTPGTRIYGKRYYIDKATGKLYDSPNGTYILFREIASGQATPLTV